LTRECLYSKKELATREWVRRKGTRAFHLSKRNQPLYFSLEKNARNSINSENGGEGRVSRGSPEEKRPLTEEGSFLESFVIQGHHLPGPVSLKKSGTTGMLDREGQREGENYLLRGGKRGGKTLDGRCLMGPTPEGTNIFNITKVRGGG